MGGDGGSPHVSPIIENLASPSPFTAPSLHNDALNGKIPNGQTLNVVLKKTNHAPKLTSPRSFIIQLFSIFNSFFQRVFI